MRVSPQMVESLVDDPHMRQRFRRIKRPPRKLQQQGCSGCGNGTQKAPVDVNELKRWMVEVLGDGDRKVLKEKFNTDVLEIRYRNKRGKRISVQL